MLTSIGKSSKSLLVKVLVGIIILPFVFWGMGDVFRGGNQNILVTIDSEKISTQDFANYLTRLSLNEQQRKNLSSTNLLEKILSEYIGRKIVELEVKKFGINVSDKSLKNIIINDKIFLKDGKFSRTEYEKFLLQSSISAPIFEKNIVEQEKKRQLLSFLSGGTSIPDYLIENEFKKENQIKTISYIDLKKYYQNQNIDDKEIKEIYEKNKELFRQEFKSISYVELTPENLSGSKEFNENFFNKINNIENEIIDGKKISLIAKENNLKLTKTKEVNRKQTDINGNKLYKIENELFNEIFNITKENTGEMINFNNKYYMIEILSIRKKNRDINDSEVRDAIISQIKIKNKIENSNKIIEKISSKKFNYTYMLNFAKDNNLDVKNLKIYNLKENDIFNENFIKKIYQMNDKEVNLITDSMFSKNFIIYSKETEFKKLDKNSESFKIYRNKAKLNLAKDIYESYDKNVNKEYKIEINAKAVDRLKNSF